MSILALPGVTAPFYSLMNGRATIFMLHRLDDPDRGVRGLKPEHLRRVLALLRRRRYELVNLGDLFSRLRGDGPPLKRAVAFTLDDGYVEQAEVGAEVFSEFDCPSTTFVTTGFLDGNLWFWWDRISWIFKETSKERLSVRLGEELLELSWDSPAARAAVEADFVERCKRVPDEEKLSTILRLATEAEVDLPAEAPHEYSPMTWEQLRASESRGMNFGPHTVTHPILSRAGSEQSHDEIAESWARLGQETQNPTPIFCYPNGGWEDFGQREIDVLRKVGLTGAVVGRWGYADVRDFRGVDSDVAFKVGRMPFSGSLPHIVQYVSGVEVAKAALRKPANPA